MSIKSMVLGLALSFFSHGVQAAAIEIVEAFPKLTFENSMVFLTHAPDSSHRLFVVEQKGLISAFPNRPDVDPSQVRLFADLTSVVRFGDGETGLLGLAFSPDFSVSRELYVSYTRQDKALVIARLKASAQNPNAVDLASLKPILIVPKRQDFPNHNCGMIAFGPDGKLYVGTGDGGGAGDPLGNAQNLGLLLGKILRIEVVGADTYTIPTDNPFVSQIAARGEIWSYGMRNPWRFSFDRRTGDLWAGDVGQDRLEEIDLIVKGGNYGWNVFEASLPFKNPKNRPASDFVAPHLEYGRSLGQSITGGYVYRGVSIPALIGTYVYGDFISGRVWGLELGQDLNTQIGQVSSLSAFGEDESGELYLLSFSGSILKLQ